MKKNFGSKGYPLIELIIVIAIVMIIIFGLLGSMKILTCDVWVGKQSALEAIQIKNPAVVKVIQLKRNFWSRSIAIVITEKGEQKYYYIDSNIFQNVEATPIPKKDY